MTQLENYSWRVFQSEDFDAIDLLPDERENILESRAFIEQAGKMHNADSIFCGTAFQGDRIFAIGGWVEISPGVVEGFLIPDRKALEHRYTLVRSFRFWLRYIRRKKWVKRIQTHSVPNKRIDRWMQALGFLYEAEVKRYTEAGQDYKLWSQDKINGTWRRQKI